ncbi:dead end protein homolog 1 [Carettochelys insculpta]|uniref:dead end protein homolog 1 n=1 Tax=Carettochelys insculpta TaxID=44489 RepID=UPI003EBBFDBB
MQGRAGARRAALVPSPVLFPSAAPPVAGVQLSRFPVAEPRAAAAVAPGCSPASCTGREQRRLLCATTWQVWSDAVNQANKRALLAWVKESGIQLVQVNGQRKYGGPPPGWIGDPPPPGSEVFIGKLPQDLYENTLLPLFQSVGKLYEFRLMMTFSGLNRGFAYAKYSNRRSAQVAIAALNNFEVQKGCPITVCRSTEKCELCVDGLAASVEQGQLRTLLQEVTAGVLNVSLYASPSRKGRQLAVLKYNSHRAAAMAKKTLVEGSLGLCGEQIEVDWLKADTKQKLHVGSERASPQSDGSQLSQAPGEAGMCPLPQAPWGLDYLIALCKKQQLGTPVFLTKCVQANSDGWLRFWYQVVIPGYPTPFSGFMWIKPDKSGLSGHDKAKNAIALQLLRTLGESFQGSVCRSSALQQPRG